MALHIAAVLEPLQDCFPLQEIFDEYPVNADRPTTKTEWINFIIGDLLHRPKELQRSELEEISTLRVNYLKRNGTGQFGVSNQAQLEAWEIIVAICL
jgi:hypothetical protein